MDQDAIPMLDLFSGAGGLSLGLSQAGLTPYGASEMDDDALNTYTESHRLFHPNVKLKIFEGDVARHSFKQHYGEFAVVAGGPPCQPYSTGGARRGALDERDGIPHFLRAISELHPETFVMENVPGLAKQSHQPILRELLNEFMSLGYYTDWKLLQSADYGVPQRRERLIIVGSKHPGFRWPTPTHGENSDTPWMPVSSVVNASSPIGEPNRSKVTYAKSPDIRVSPWAGHLWNGGGRPMNPDSPAPTLIASMGGNKTPWIDGGHVVREYHSYLLGGGRPLSGIVPGARRISVEEAALIQGFPIDMPWRGTTSSRYRQIGNAVPVGLASAVGTAIVQHAQQAKRESVMGPLELKEIPTHFGKAS